jgi:plasminogen activator inhibitor 1 RNA-binding protein
VKPVEKREGGGPHNWGTINDELIGETEALNTTGSEEVPAGGENHPAAGVEEAPVPQEEQVKEYTLDEWKAMQSGGVTKEARPQFNIRKAGEGEDDSQWKKKYVPIKRDNEQKSKKNVVEEQEEQGDEEEAHAKKQLLDIQINWVTEADRGGEYGGRGGPRGGPRGFGRGGREGGRGGRGGQGGFGGGRGGGPRGGGRRGDFQIDNESFPELGAATA